jgi:hypothetical protein
VRKNWFQIFAFTFNLYRSTKGRPWALDEMVEVNINDSAMQEAKMSALVNALLQGKGPRLREKTAEELELEKETPIEPQDAARRYLEERRVAGQSVGWRNYEHQMVHSFLGGAKYKFNPVAPELKSARLRFEPLKLLV